MPASRNPESSIGTILMICAAMIVVAIADTLPSVQAPGIIHRLKPLQQISNFSALAPATIDKKRTLYYHHWQSFAGFNVYWTAFNSIVPTVAAAESLLDFYLTISANAAPGGFWTQFPLPNNHFGTRHGYFELEFMCEQHQITWQLIYNFAQFMIQQSIRNFVGTYTAMVSLEPHEVDIFIILRIRSE